ncbi:hypothetical protein HYT84_03345 [Candidatus Micrarchaeota archaeon]|nr:hypothetical protein [Candidatus Micrarchaeota archaeon]
MSKDISEMNLREIDELLDTDTPPDSQLKRVISRLEELTAINFIERFVESREYSDAVVCEALEALGRNGRFSSILHCLEESRSKKVIECIVKLISATLRDGSHESDVSSSFYTFIGRFPLESLRPNALDALIRAVSQSGREDLMNSLIGVICRDINGRAIIRVAQTLFQLGRVRSLRRLSEGDITPATKRILEDKIRQLETPDRLGPLKAPAKCSARPRSRTRLRN